MIRNDNLVCGHLEAQEKIVNRLSLTALEIYSS